MALCGSAKTLGEDHDFDRAHRGVGLGFSRSSDVPGLISAMEDFTAARAAYLSFKVIGTSLPSLERTTSFAPSRLTTEPRIRTGSALAVAQPSAKGRTSAARMEVGTRGCFGN